MLQALRLALVHLLALCALILPHPVSGQGLPPATFDGLPDMVLTLELVINNAVTGKLAKVTLREHQILLAVRDLRAAGITLNLPETAQLNLSTVPEVEATYESETQRLLIRVPDQWLPNQHFENSQAAPRIRPETNFGAMLNYDLYVTASNTGNSASLWTDARLFDGFGTIRSTGAYRGSFGRDRGAGKAHKFTRFDTNWTYVDDETVHTFEAGDVISATLPWATPVRLGGVQLSRNFEVRPDIVTFPVPSFNGSASVPTTVDLFVNGTQVASNQVQPGPFSITQLPYVSGAGQAVLVTTDALGRPVNTVLPFYISSTLLRKGLADYALSAGKLRRGYGIRSFAYGEMVFQGSARYGLTQRLTVEGQVQAAGNLRVAGIGGVFQLGTMGVLDASATFSKGSGTGGQQFSAGYQYSNSWISIGASHRWRSEAFRELADLDMHGGTARNQTQVIGAVNLAKYGTFSISYLALSARGSTARLLNLSYSAPLSDRLIFGLSASRNLSTGGYSGGLRLTVPFAGRGTASAGLERPRNGPTVRQLSYNQPAPIEGGFGWRGAAMHDSRGGYHLALEGDLRTRDVRIEGGFNVRDNARGLWGSINGSLVAMGGKLFTSERIENSFVVVTTGGVADIPIRYENQLIGKTGRSGHLLIPRVTPYYGASYAVEPTDLPADHTIAEPVRRAAVGFKAGRTLRFAVEKTSSALVHFVDATGKPLPAGSAVDVEAGTRFYVGNNGVAYIEKLKPHNKVTIDRQYAPRCSASFDYVEVPNGVTKIGPILCR